MASESEGEEKTHKGGCLCGSVRYEVRGALRPALICHCSMCQRQHGGPAHYSAAMGQSLRLTAEEGLTWYRASPHARRGFCKACGSSLFWKPEEGDYTAVSCGSLDPPSQVSVAGHVYLVDQGDYYEIHDSLPRFQRGSGSTLPGVTTVLSE